jgi:hypothetical protein
MKGEGCEFTPRKPPHTNETSETTTQRTIETVFVNTMEISTKYLDTRAAEPSNP